MGGEWASEAVYDVVPADSATPEAATLSHGTFCRIATWQPRAVPRSGGWPVNIQNVLAEAGGRFPTLAFAHRIGTLLAQDCPKPGWGLATQIFADEDVSPVRRRGELWKSRPNMPELGGRGKPSQGSRADPAELVQMGSTPPAVGHKKQRPTPRAERSSSDQVLGRPRLRPHPEDRLLGSSS